MRVRNAGRPDPQLWCERTHTQAPAHRDACNRLTRNLRSCPTLLLPPRPVLPFNTVSDSCKLSTVQPHKPRSCFQVPTDSHVTGWVHGGGGGRGPAPWGRGRSGWATVGGCAGRWPGCGACPLLGFAERGRCRPSPSGLQSRIYFRPKWGVGGGPSPTPLERVSRERRSTRPGVDGRTPAHGVCSSSCGGGASDSRALPEDFGRNVRSKTSRPSRQSAICGRRTPESVLSACHVH